MTIRLLLALSLLGIPKLVRAQVDFVRDVRPIFEAHCYDCHSGASAKSSFRLDVKQAALKGGDRHSPDIHPGNAKESPLIRLVTSSDEDERMPRKGAPLSAKEIATLTRWIDEGATWPDGVDTAKIEDPRDHWSFKPLPPQADGASIDGFILAKLRDNGLGFSPEADRATWLRRVTLDLTGLPPSPEDVAAFLGDKRADRYARSVDRLLASPRYGERWAQHWLDVVRYADTHGFEVNTERPNAWPYRDYVIRAFNADKPYDQFIREQIAGDALGADAATGFLVTASVLLPGQIGKDAPSMRLARQDSLDEIVKNISQTFLGLSVACARCHNHKFDPISAKDYYSMQAFVAGVDYGARETITPETEESRGEVARLNARRVEIENEIATFLPLANSGVRRPMVNARKNTDRFAPVAAKRLRFTTMVTNLYETCIDELEVFNTDGANVALATAGSTCTSSGNITVFERHELRFVNDGRYGNTHSWMASQGAMSWVEIEFARKEKIDRVVWGRDREGQYADRLAVDYKIEVSDGSGKWSVVAGDDDRTKYDPKATAQAQPSPEGLSPEEADRLARLMRDRTDILSQMTAAEKVPKVFAGIFRAPDDIHVLSRGDPEQPEAAVAPAVPVALGNLILPRDTPEQKRRVALADWIANPENPLTARVMANRIWQRHFGAGLVPTPNDFGNNGVPPSHPKLLDWLASELIRSGWSVKHMHRIIVLSRTYRQQSSANAEGLENDAGARLLWRYPPRRIDAETIRDSMLAASGELNLTMFGPGFDLFHQRGGLSGFTPVESFTGDGLRRMIYAHKIRRETDAVFGAFDCPDGGQSAAVRRESTTPIQALNLFNSRFTLDRAAALAARVEKQAGTEVSRQIVLAYRFALNRDPSAEELRMIEPVVREHGLAAFCRVLYNCNEFLFMP